MGPISSVAALLREGGAGWIEQLRIKFEIESVRKKHLDELGGRRNRSRREREMVVQQLDGIRTIRRLPTLLNMDIQ
jgi:hypothetical protein